MKRAVIFILLFLTTLGWVLFTHRHHLMLPGSNWCAGVGYLPDNRPTETIHAVHVTAKPWRGEHHVYGIFELDEQKVPPGQPVIVRVSGAAKYCTTSNPVGNKFRNIEAPEGYYLSRHYIRTRTGFWVTLLGQRGKLKQPQNWTLTYAK